MNWENIGKISVTLVCVWAVVGVIYLIMRIVYWKSHVDDKIELQDEVNRELFQRLKDIKFTIEEAISEKGSEE